MKIIELSPTKILCYLVRLLRKFWISYQLSKTSKHRNVFYQTLQRKHKINVSECARHATYLLYDEYLVVFCETVAWLQTFNDIELFVRSLGTKVLLSPLRDTILNTAHSRSKTQIWIFLHKILKWFYLYIYKYLYPFE